MDLIDSFGRKINYLRLSVTDRCNMRCRYCMPAGGVGKLEHGAILSYEELMMVAETAVPLGIEKIRVTGGEPLVRKGIIDFLGRLAAIPELKQLVLTTNGVLLEKMAGELKKAGVQRLNISLDSLKPGTFASVTRGGSLDQVLAGISAAEAAGFPIKLNMVVMRGINDDEIADFAGMSLNRNLSVRFIEYMPAIREENWQALVLPGQEILDRIAARYRFTPIDRGDLCGPARIFQIEGAVGTIGVITPITGHFCSECNRIRVTSSGRAKSCLFSDVGEDLRPYLRNGDREGLKAALTRLVGYKPEAHRLTADNAEHAPFNMAKIGG